MAKLTSPSITIIFSEQGASAITRGERGIVALALKDTKQQILKIYGIKDIPDTGLSEDNIQYIKDTLKGYTNSPRYIVVYVMKTADDMTKAYKDMEKYFNTEKFDYIAIPTVKTDGKVEEIITWIKGKRDKDSLVKAVLPEVDSADSEGIINWSSILYRTNDKPITPEQGTPRIAGLLAGTSVTVSATYAPLRDFVDVARLTKDEQDEAVGKGKLIAFWDGEKVKLNRAVTSFVTTTVNKLDSFKKIKLVEVMDMMKSDIKQTIEDSYIGKFNNSYDNKCLLITAINGYFQELINDDILSVAVCEINLEAQKAWLKKLGKKVILDDGTEKSLEECKDDEIKKANTGSYVFLKAKVSILDAIEDVELEISI